MIKIVFKVPIDLIVKKGKRKVYSLTQPFHKLQLINKNKFPKVTFEINFYKNSIQYNFEK